MKKYFLLIPTIVFPYCVLFSMYCIYSGCFMESLFQNSVFSIILHLAIIWIISIVLAILFVVISLKSKCNITVLAKVNVFVKLIHIPAYIIIFVVGIACFITIFTAYLAIILFLLDIMTIILSGLIGLTIVVKFNIIKALNNKASLIHGILQFVFCMDLISAILLYKKTRNVF